MFRLMILRLAECEDKEKQGRKEKHTDLEACSLAEAAANLDDMGDLGYQRKIPTAIPNHNTTGSGSFTSSNTISMIHVMTSIMNHT